MIVIYVDFILSKVIEIERFGLKFRMLNSAEKSMLKSETKKVFGYKTEIESLIKKYNGSDLYLIDLYEIKDETRKNILMAGYQMLSGSFVFNSMKKINEIIDHLIVIEVDNSVLYKFIDPNLINKFISNFLSFYSIYSDVDFKNPNLLDRDYSYVLNDKILNKENDFFYLNLFSHIICHYKLENDSNKKIYLKKIELSEDFLQRICNFISMLSSNDVVKFFEILDLLFCDKSLVQNKLLNNVTIIESLLINDNDAIQKSFVLKAGLILKNSINATSDITNINVKHMLNFVYNIRSDIIHGNYRKLEDNLNSLTQKVKDIKSVVGINETFKDKRNQAYKIAFLISYFAVVSVLRVWINSYSFVAFLKNN